MVFGGNHKHSVRQPENGAVGFQAAVNVCFCKDADYSTWAFSGCLIIGGAWRKSAISPADRQPENACRSVAKRKQGRAAQANPFSGCLSLCLQRNTLGAARVNH
ncbi:hypothetical protein [Kingella oralis]